MSDRTITLIAGGVLLLHGLGHGGAAIALAWIRLRPGTPTGDWLEARSWLVPSLAAPTATTLAGAFWIVLSVAVLAVRTAAFPAWLGWRARRIPGHRTALTLQLLALRSLRSRRPIAMAMTPAKIADHEM